MSTSFKTNPSQNVPRETAIPQGAACGTCKFFDHTKFTRYGLKDQRYGRCIAPDMQNHPRNESRTITDACYLWEKRSVPIRLQVKSGTK